ncbi:hypothetical protein K0M31_004355, partial [Melipona bicolor]
MLYAAAKGKKGYLDDKRKKDGTVGRDLGHRRGTIYLAVHRVAGLEARRGPLDRLTSPVADRDSEARACERCDVAGDVAGLTQTRLPLGEGPSCGRLYCFFRKYTPSRRARLSVNHLAPGRRRGIRIISDERSARTKDQLVLGKKSAWRGSGSWTAEGGVSPGEGKFVAPLSPAAGKIAGIRSVVCHPAGEEVAGRAEAQRWQEEASIPPPRRFLFNCDPDRRSSLK